MLTHTEFRHSAAPVRGFILIEVLISIVILAIGLLGLAKLQVSTRQMQMESYQRAQAVILLQDMVTRLSINSKAATCYALTDPATGKPYLGVGGTVPASCGTGTTLQQVMAVQDMTAWDNQLLGVAESTAAGASVGAMIDARGCVSYDAANDIYVVTVVWRGLVQTAAPPAGLTCGINLYGPDSQRRAVSAVVRVPNLRPT
jgi:type IV pilus assembly protein PilV